MENVRTLMESKIHLILNEALITAIKSGITKTFQESDISSITTIFENGSIIRTSTDNHHHCIDDFYGEGRPAMEFPGGIVAYYYDGKLNRLNDRPAVLIPGEGIEAYYKYGFLHAYDHPAITNKYGYEEWRIEGVLHNFRGPALIEEKEVKRYYIFGKEISRETFLVIDRFFELLRCETSLARDAAYNYPELIEPEDAATIARYLWGRTEEERKEFLSVVTKSRNHLFDLLFEITSYGENL